MKIPNNLLYSYNHLWFRKIGVSEFQVGLSFFFLHSISISQLGSFEFERDFFLLNKNENFGRLNTEKTNIDLSMPFNGELLFSNKDLSQEIKYLRESPYHCWLAVLSSTEDDTKLLLPAQYKHFIEKL